MAVLLLLERNSWLSRSLQAGRQVVMFAVQFRMSTLKIFSQMPQNVKVILCVNSLILEGKFMLHNPVNVKENHHLVLCSTSGLTCTNNSL